MLDKSGSLPTSFQCKAIYIIWFPPTRVLWLSWLRNIVGYCCCCVQSTADHHRLAASLPSSVSDDVSLHHNQGSTYPDVMLDQPIPPAEYSDRYASRPLPQTPQSPSPSSSCPYNMSLARALDHNLGRQISSSPEIVTHVVDSCVDQPPESELPVTSETNTRYVSTLTQVRCKRMYVQLCRIS